MAEDPAEDGAGEVQGAVTGIINPPPDLRLIVDKTALFVAKNGKVFESRILQKNVNDVKFGFLRQDNPFHKYYQAKVDELAIKIHNEQQEKAKPKPAAEPAASAKKEVETEDKKPEEKKPEVSAPVEAAVSKAPKLKLVAKVAGNKKERKDTAPPEFEFLLKHPDPNDVTMEVTPAKLEIMKLTAQYTAILGRSFLSEVALKEVSNPDFNFLRPSHRHFTYFTSLVDSYHKLIDKEQRKKTMETLENLFKDRLTILDRCVHRVEWKQQEEEKERQKLDEDKSEQIAFLQIDWHDFVVVETISFDDKNEVEGDESTANTGAVGDSKTETAGESNKQKQDKDDSDDDDMDMDMDEESDSEEKVEVRTDYVPKVVTGEERTKMVTLPDGRRIAADDLNEHVRVELIDPQARENQKRFMEKQQNVPFANRDISRNLAKLASHRPDVFGIDEQVAEKEREEAEKKRKESQAVIWDGSTNTVAQVTLAAQINKERRQQQQSTAPTPSGSGIGPSLSAPPQRPSRPPPPMQPQVRPPPQQQMMQKPPPPLPPQFNPPMGGPPMGGPPPPMGGPPMGGPPMGGPPMGAPPVPPPQFNPPMGGPPMGVPPHLQRNNPPGPPGPPQKKMKMDDQVESLIPETVIPRLPSGAPPGSLVSADEFASRYPGKVSLSVVISEPDEKWNLTPQTIQVEVPSIMSTVLETKQQILSAIATTLPVGKFQLKSNAFLKDKQTLAEANVTPGSSLELKVKQRGGRR